MRLINVETQRLETFNEEKIPPYAILSHTWGADEEEISFADIQKETIEARGSGTKKLIGCCNQAKTDGLKYAWIDTCCINKESSKELDEAVNCMFKWYSKASVCYAYLADVPSGDNPRSVESKFYSSRWFSRGWTLQELLAPEELQLFNQEWSLIGTKADLSAEIEQITGIPRPYLLGWVDFRHASVAQRISWAAKRQTSRKEDAAYCLLGIFDITMNMIYGEGDRAWTRLQLEIMTSTMDQSILAWGFEAGEPSPRGLRETKVMSSGALAAAPSDFTNCSRIVVRKASATRNPIEISGGHLRIHLPLRTLANGQTYALLNCGLEADQGKVVGIPINRDLSKGAAENDYLRPQGHQACLIQSSEDSGKSAEYIRILMDRQGVAHESTNEQVWLFIDGHQRLDLKLEEVYPPTEWDKGRARIAQPGDFRKGITKLFLLRFRPIGGKRESVIVVLELKILWIEPEVCYHVMTSSSGIVSKDLLQAFSSMRTEVLGKQTAKIGDFTIKVSVKPEQVAQAPMFNVSFSSISGSNEATVDADLELGFAELKAELRQGLQAEAHTRTQIEEWTRQRHEKEASSNQMLEELTVMDEKLKQLVKDKMELADRREQELQQVLRLEDSLKEATKQQEIWAARISELQDRLDALDSKQSIRNSFVTLNALEISNDFKGARSTASDYLRLSTALKKELKIGDKSPLLWAAENGQTSLVKLLVEKRASLSSVNDMKQKLLLVAALNGHREIVSFLLEEGASTEPDGDNVSTPLELASREGHDAIVRILLEKGAKVDSINQEGKTPLLLASANGHEAVVRVLLENGSNADAKDESGVTPLIRASFYGHEEVVRLLLDNGADIEAKEKHGYTALAHAKKRYHKSVEKLLLERGAKKRGLHRFLL
jgi:ankyrin repeat protein